MRAASLTKAADTFTLAPVQDVAMHGNRFEAREREPWIRVTPDDTFVRGRIIEMRFAGGPHDCVVRPILRFVLSDGQVRDALLPAAGEGIGIWRGRVPRETIEVRISPTSAEHFAFTLLSVRLLPFRTLLRFAVKSPKRAFFVAGARLAHLQAEVDLNLAWMFGQAETQDFIAWRAARTDAVPCACSIEMGRISIAIIVSARSALVEDVATTLDSLRRQTFDAWRLILLDPDTPVADWAMTVREPRVAVRTEFAVADLPANSLVSFLRAGDTIASYGLTAFAARFGAEEALGLVYADEYRLKGRGGRAVFKPDWSPVWQKYAPYVGRAAICRASLLVGQDFSFQNSPEAMVERLLARLGNERVGHLRRAAVMLRDEGPAPVPAPARQTHERPPPAVGIIVPTRDRLDLLKPCIESVLRMTDYPDFRIVIADNGSIEPATLRWFAGVVRDPRVRVAHTPGPFNFADICNRAARLLDTDLLLFLNNDTGVLQEVWLRNLVSFAARPDIGAVGAKLLHKDGRVQHAGVVLGLGGVAGHFGAGLRDDEPGWLGGNQVPHEVSAVTGACLMVEARKFWGVGGFDAENLPVELNDIDLCLRLTERGWRTLCDSRTRLLHHESASRGGATFRLQRVYAAERRYFVERWRHILRDDPHFNPNLSLYARRPALW